jgi:hypothetical protein
MLYPGFPGPQEQWRAELEGVNKLGLLSFIDGLIFHLDWITGGMRRESLLKTVRDSKKDGEWDAAHASFIRMQQNPSKFFDEKDRRRSAAKRAARRRKKASK